MYVLCLYVKVRSKICCECYMENMVWKRVGKRQMYHDAKLSAIFYI